MRSEAGRSVGGQSTPDQPVQKHPEPVVAKVGEPPAGALSLLLGAEVHPRFGPFDAPVRWWFKISVRHLDRVRPMVRISGTGSETSFDDYGVEQASSPLLMLEVEVRWTRTFFLATQGPQDLEVGVADAVPCRRVLSRPRSSRLLVALQEQTWRTP